MSDREKRRIAVNALGPHYEIQGHDVPAAVRDSSMGTMPNVVDDQAGVSIEHIHPGVEMATVTWDPDAKYPEKTLEFDVDELSEEWYSEDPYDYEDNMARTR